MFTSFAFTGLASSPIPVASCRTSMAFPHYSLCRSLRRGIRQAAALLLAPLFLASVGGCGAADEVARETESLVERADGEVTYEVWVVDQSDSNHLDGFGGTIQIFQGADLTGQNPGTAVPINRVDLGAETADLCRDATGAAPVRPHMLSFNREGSHAVLSFLQSGHVAILDTESRAPLECFRMSLGRGGARQAHSAVPAPDGGYVVVSNKDGKLLERIDTDFETNKFIHDSSATLDLATGTTPAGRRRESEEFRPDNAPICLFIDAQSRYTWVTLRGGGLFVVDARMTPMSIVAEYDRQMVKEGGCGGIQAGGHMFLNSGAVGGAWVVGGLPYPHSHRFEVYRFPLVGYESGSEPNVPAPDLVFAPDGERDSQAMVVIPGTRYLWVVDRHIDVIEVLKLPGGEWVNTVTLTGPFTERPAPNQLTVSPAGDRVFTTFRGPTPIFGDPHNAHGTTPGLGIIRVDEAGRSGELLGIVPFSNEFLGRQMADPHALAVRRLP